MANKDRLRGFWPIRHLSGGEIRLAEYTCTTSTTIYKGDLVKLVTGGTVEIGAADIGNGAIGVAAQTVSSAAAGAKILIWDDPMIVFGVQTDSGGSPTIADIGALANHLATTGDTVTLISKNELDDSDIDTGSQLRTIGLVDQIDNVWGEHADVEVVFNEHMLKNNTLTT